MILLFEEIISFTNISFRKHSFKLLCKNNLPEKKPEILNIDFESLINEYDNLALNNFDGNIPSAPSSEEEIIEDSFEGYLKSEFYKIANVRIRDHENKIIIDFNTFYTWRKKIGTVLYDEEIYDIFKTINKKNDCDLMNFILINKIIDENDGADF